MMGGHVDACEDCEHLQIAYNSCRNRSCPKCQSIAAKEWLADREAELLPVPYFHLVFSLPQKIADIAFQNRAVVCEMLFKGSSETLIAIAADPKHLGAKIGMTSVLHTWGSALTHHPHVHIIVPGGGISLDGKRWVTGRPRFFLSVKVLSRLFSGIFLAKLKDAYQAGRLQFLGHLAGLTDPKAFKQYLAPLYQSKWVVYAKRPFGGPEAVLAYLSRYTHRIAISNSRLIAFNDQGVTFKWKDYRAKGQEQAKVMTLATDEFIRRFLMHVPPSGFHRIRHYGLLANGNRAENIARARQLLKVPKPIPPTATEQANDNEPKPTPNPCPCCGGRMFIIERFDRGCVPRHQPIAPIRIDSS